MTTLEYQQSPKSKLQKFKTVLDWVVLVAAVVLFVEADTILDAAGGMVWYCMMVAAIALYPLGWGRGQVMKVLALLLCLGCFVRAYHDNKQGLIRQERILRVQLVAEAKQGAATQGK
jgi:hypothetical protein